MVKSEWQVSQNDSISNRTGLMLMTLVLLLAFALGADGLNADVIWLDELYSVSDMGVFNPPRSPAQIINSIRGQNVHVPLFFLMVAGWAQLAGWSQFALRFMSLVSGVLMIAWLYRLAADAVNRRTAVAAALLMSTNAFAILYFHELRMYALLMLLAVMHSGLYWRLAHGFRATRLMWFLFILTAAMLLYTHNYAIIVFAGLGGYHLLFVSKSRRWLNIMLAWGVGALLFLPYAPLWIEDLLQNSSRWVSPIDNIQIPPSLRAVAAIAHLWVNGFHLLWLALILSFGCALRRRRNPAILRLLVIALMMMASLLAVGQFASLPTSRMRYSLILWFPFFILFAYGLTSVPRWRLVTTLFLLLWSAAGYQLSRSAEILDYASGPKVAEARLYPPLYEYLYHLKHKANAADYLIGFTSLMLAGWSPADYYLQAQPGLDGVFLSASRERYQLESDVKAILDEHPYVLLAYNPANPPLNADKTLKIMRQEGYIPCAVIMNKPDWQARRYVNQVMGCDHQPAPIVYDNRIKVIDRFARYVPESEVLQILTWWEVADEGLLDEYNVSMQIITPDWRNVRQEDRHLYELPPWDVIELSTEGLPPGDYRLMMILYHRDTGEKVSGLDLTSGETGNLLPLLAFTIEPPE